MEIKFGSDNKKQEKTDKKTGKKKDKEEQIPLSEIKMLYSLNIKALSSLEKDSKLYNFKQDRREVILSQTEQEISEGINSLKKNIESINEQLSKIKKEFTLIAKNFKTFVKKDELLHVNNKINSFKFEEYITEEELDNELKNL